MASDIGTILFVEILRMTQYPGSPFTGNIYRDLILFLIVPTIFIIMVLYIASGRIIPDKKIRVMVGVGGYLFILASGYYSAFALLAGPYFIFLIFILGLFGFFASHFKRGGSYSGGSYSGGGGGLLRMGKINPIEKRALEEELITVAEALSGIESGSDRPDEYARLVKQKNELSREIFGRILSNDEIHKKYGIKLHRR